MVRFMQSINLYIDSFCFPQTGNTYAVSYLVTVSAATLVGKVLDAFVYRVDAVDFTPLAPQEKGALLSHQQQTKAMLITPRRLRLEAEQERLSHRRDHAAGNHEPHEAQQDVRRRGHQAHEERQMYLAPWTSHQSVHFIPASVVVGNKEAHQTTLNELKIALSTGGFYFGHGGAYNPASNLQWQVRRCSRTTIQLSIDNSLQIGPRPHTSKHGFFSQEARMFHSAFEWNVPWFNDIARWGASIEQRQSQHVILIARRHIACRLARAPVPRQCCCADHLRRATCRQDHAHLSRQLKWRPQH